ncbi:MAG: hypothetical protein JNN00_08360 [Chitinophagaceae bacterium]|nr:hypothetical protein [Chitinophagaceae bacterium]
MKKIATLVLVIAHLPVLAQTESFDLATYTVLKGWKKQSQSQAIQFAKENTVNGAYCMITLFKSIDASENSKTNFDESWQSLVKQTLGVGSPPEMQQVTQENGWEIQNGYAPFEKDGNKGIALLVTSTGFTKAVNILILTNTNEYEAAVTQFLESVYLKKPVGKKATANKPAELVPAKPETTSPGAFTFAITNFDDGWTSSVQEGWVQVIKGAIKVLVHYPNKKADAYNSVLKEEDYNAWNTLVSPRYSHMTNFEWKTIQSYESITFVQADAVENASGKTVHIVLFKKHYSNGNGRYLEFITDNKAAYENEFGAYHNTEFDWDKPANMQFRNKFAVAASDLIGKWSTSDYASISYYYVNTGGLAGTSTTSTANEFTFTAGNNYQSQHSGASGMAGNMKFSNQVYKGKSTVTNWVITLNNRFEGATENYNCHFEAIKGGRFLLMTDRLGTTYALIKSK